ncbi:inner membrane-spanning protein YciB [Caenispirillum salinarum]|uniref:inner membrane-spanning protein YciB n=1 Tax=Caenispirillum salinarum TaxID=859058 RepID=UPI00384CBD77
MDITPKAARAGRRGPRQPGEARPRCFGMHDPPDAPTPTGRARTGPADGRSGGGRASSWRLGATVERIALELGPAIAFFLTVRFYDIFAGTIVLLVAGVLSTAVSWSRGRRVPVVPFASLALTGVLGGATLIMEEGRFIKMRPTIINAVAALVLAGGLMRGHLLLRSVLGAGTEAEPAAWRRVTIGIVLFLLGLSVTNEIVWRTVSTEAWAGFKAFAIPALDALAFWLAYRHLRRHACSED